MIKFHKTDKGLTIAEILHETDLITNADDMLDIMADAGYHGSDRIIIHMNNLHQDFFDLKTGLAGEILQKFSNYRMRMAITGDFSGFKSKSLRDFIRESNSRGIICFVESMEAAFSRLDH